ncbi:MAG: SRPBCC family protein [Chloroflexota bacterium]
MEVIRQLNVNAPATRLWEILAENYDRVGEWTSEITQSASNPDLNVGEGRVCTTPGFGDVKETITAYDEKRRQFSYAAEISSFPFFVKDVGNSWRVEEKGINRAVVHMHMNAKLLPIFAQLMGPVMKRQMGKAADVILEELKYYAETDEIHPRKQEQLRAATLQAA